MSMDAPVRITLPPVTVLRAGALVGMPYAEGTFDCAHLAVLAQEYLWGRQVLLPLKGAHPRGARRQARAIERLRVELAARVQQPDSGDVALFTCIDDAGQLQYHIGTVVVEAGETWVLHTSEALRSSVLQRLAEVKGVVLEGFYRWK